MVIDQHSLKQQSSLPQQSRVEHFNCTRISTFEVYMLKGSMLQKILGKVTANFSSPSLSHSSFIPLILLKVTRQRVLICSSNTETS